MPAIRRLLWLLVFAACLLAVYVVAVYMRQSTELSKDQNPGIIKTDADIGGLYSLTSHTGTKVSSTDFAGKLQLIYFGFTYCPDICPMELQTITSVMNRLPPELADQVQPVFITIDPERDTPEHLAEYLGLFHPRFMGLTGSQAEIKKVADEYKIYFQKVEDPGSSQYLMDHTTFTYLMDQEGSLIALFRYPANPDLMLQEVRQHLKGTS